MSLPRRTPITRRPAKRRPPRDTGPSDKVRARVLELFSYSCVATGKPLTGWWSMQHRVARGVGGDNSFPNLIPLLGSATSPGPHRQCEDRDPEMHRRGYWLKSNQNPAEIPILLVTEAGSRWVLIAEDGSELIDTDPPEETL